MSDDREHLKRLCRLGEEMLDEPTSEAVVAFRVALLTAIQHLADTAQPAAGFEVRELVH